MAVRVFLTASALVWLPYGLFCFAQPSFLIEAAGISASSTTGTTELRAMYGGLQAALGALAAVALLRPALVRPALVTLAFLTAGLAAGRLGGVGLDGGVSSYTIGGLAFEIISATVAVWLLTRGSKQALA
jgi:hypothetical protein